MDEIEQRPPRARSPELSNWGVFGDDDELGAINYQTPAAVLRGAAEIQKGDRYPLNLPADLPRQRPIGRPEFSKVAHLHNVEFDGMVTNDDHIVLATQGSSQWDSFVHAGCYEEGVDGVFYNGFTPDDIDADGFVRRGGIDKIAQRGIAGRGVLVDVARMIAGGAADPLPLDYTIGESEFLACLGHQGTEVQPGDILCFRTGWSEAYLDADEAGRSALMSPAPGEPAPLNPGIHSELARLAHEQRWSAVTADNLGVEVHPFRPDNKGSAHVRLQRNLGIPFGEIFCYRDLATSCADDRRWSFFFVAVPLWIPGGMGSPSNAMALR
jgi:kynurenine formamidase